MNRTLLIIRGTSGSGKSTLSNLITSICKDDIMCSIHEADMFFIDDKGNYNFDATKLEQAHAQCLKNVEIAMDFFGRPLIILSNTSTTEKELLPYLELAQKYEYQVISVVLENRHGNANTHNVPEKTIKNQEQRLRNSIKLS